MRKIALFPLLTSIVAIVLGFLCLFSGDKPGFMNNYDILTLNTSRIGQNLVQSASSSGSSNPFTNLLHNLTQPFESIFGSAVSSLAHDLGIRDFYSVHLFDYCEGAYTPSSLPNATLKASSIKRNVTYCSPRKAWASFDPTSALQRSLDESGSKITLKDLDWPQKLEDGIKGLNYALHGAFVLYCLGIAFAFLALIIGLVWLLAPSDGGRRYAALETFVAVPSFVGFGIASVLATIMAVKGNSIIDKYGKPIGVSADRGNGFLGMSWAATAMMFLATLTGCVDFCFGRKKRISTK